MYLKEECDVDGNLEYKYLIPRDPDECAIFLELQKLYPKYFEVLVVKKYPNDYNIRLKIKPFVLAEHLPPDITVTYTNDAHMGTYFDTTDFKLGKDKDIVSDLLDKVENNLKCSACGSDDLKILYTEKPHVPKTIFIDHYSCGSCSAEQQVRRDAE